jgi:hypothetical protein
MSAAMLKYLAGRFEELRRNIEEDLAKGAANEIAEYKYHCGRHRGLLQATNILIETAENMEKDDD